MDVAIAKKCSLQIAILVETEILTQSKNLELLMNLAGKWVDRVHQRKSLKQIILDMYSSVSPTYGNQ